MTDSDILNVFNHPRPIAAKMGVAISYYLLITASEAAVFRWEYLNKDNCSFWYHKREIPINPEFFYFAHDFIQEKGWVLSSRNMTNNRYNLGTFGLTPKRVTEYAIQKIKAANSERYLFDFITHRDLSIPIDKIRGEIVNLNKSLSLLS